MRTHAVDVDGDKQHGIAKGGEAGGAAGTNRLHFQAWQLKY